MKKKLEAELISIAHRILKLKNRAELDQLQQETLKLYEKISVLRFVEDNFSDVKPTIGKVSAEEALEEIYGLEEQPEVKANEVEAKEETAKQEKEAAKAKEEVKEEKKETPKAEEKPAKPEAEEPKQESEKEKAEEQPEEEDAEEEPEAKIEIEKPAEEVKAMEEAATAVFEKEEDSTIEEEEKAADAAIVTIEPDKETKTEDSGLGFDFAFERTAAPEEPAKQKEITFEDYRNYVEPEFVKKDDNGSPAKAEEPKPEAVKEPEEEKQSGYRDWRDWEPAKSEEKEAPKEEVKAEVKTPEPPKQETPKEEPKQESTVKGNIASRSDFEKPRSLNDALGKSISLGLNDRIAFEKHLFGGSADDLNRVLSQLNTIHTFKEAKDFINELVKPDYNDWKDKEEYEERFMEIVEKKFD